jgi:hypothetical protein
MKNEAKLKKKKSYPNQRDQLHYKHYEITNEPERSNEHHNLC